MEAIEKILKQYWGYTTFRPLQESIINAILEGKDVLALLPTGGGKSICFQVPTLARPGLCIVITPLIALMKDQVLQLKKKDIAAVAIHTGMSAQAVDGALDNCIYGPTKLLYVSPERLETEIFQARLQRMQVNLIAVDEAHCISQWGYDFRPAYLKIAQLREWLPTVPVVALTATATDEVKKDIQDRLQFRNGVIFQQSFRRSNLHYQVKRTEDKPTVLLKVLKKRPSSAIVYVATRKKTMQISKLLNKNGVSATYYHGGLDPVEREEKQQAWTNNQVSCMVATNAFGMGIDKPDVRMVIHWEIPTTLEAYYQEAGRAGRDGLPAYAILLYDEQDIITLHENIQKNNLSVDTLRRCYQQLINYYQIGIGSSPTGPYLIDWEQFATSKQLPLTTTYQAIRQLALAGILEVNDAFEEKARILFQIGHQTVYQYLETNYPYQLLLQALLRLYGGELFSHFCTISEHTVARYLQVTTDQVKQQLHILDQTGILLYHPPRHQPQITFLCPHLLPHQLPLSATVLQEKANHTLKKAAAVIHYATHLHRCREQLLLEYFGEISYQSCTHCDRCRARMEQDTIQSQKTIKDHILAQLTPEGCFPNPILDQIDAPELAIIASIQELLEAGEIYYDGAQRLVKS